MDSIIVIDNDKNTTTLVARSLENDFNVYQSHCSLDGEEIINSFFPSLVILDIGMKEMDGYELCSKIKTKESTKNIPIILTSHKASSVSRCLAYRLGAIHYLEKPLNLQELPLLSKAIIDQNCSSHGDHILEFENLYLDTKNHYCSDDHNEYRLTHSECIILETLIIKKSEIVNREILANKLSIYSKKISFRTVDSHICSIRKKIKKSGIAISPIYNVGYRLQKTGKTSLLNRQHRSL